jgi:beta-phosphoglucomutase
MVFAMAAAIFDLDGVIVDTAKYHYRAWRRLAAELGFEFGEERNELLKGVSRMRSLEILLDTGGLAGRFTAEEKERLAARKNGWYVEYLMALDEREILDGAVECLREYRSSGVRTALGTASRNAGLILERLGIGGHFDAVVDGNRVSKAKPDPEVFIVAAADLGVPHGACAVFEDAAAGIEAAKRCGMHAVGIGSPEVLSAADEVISGIARFHELDIRAAGMAGGAGGGRGAA